MSDGLVEAMQNHMRVAMRKHFNSTLVSELIADDAVTQALAALKANGFAVVQGWQDIASAPKDEPILAAIRVTWQGGDPYWDRHIICIDSEEDRITDCDFDHGFEWDDYDLWMPLPVAPLAAAGEG